MKAKLFAFAVAVFSAAIIGLVQLQSDAVQPGQVNGTQRCTIDAVGNRATAFHTSGNTATVRFSVTGSRDCKVRASVNSFYAPTMSGKPYGSQTLYQRTTRVYTPGTYSASVALPVKSTKAKGCYYQTDLTYGTANVTPVLAFHHGKLDCSPLKNPAASCNALVVTMLGRTTFRFNGSATLKDGAKVKSYTFAVKNSTGTTVFSKTTTAANLAYSQATPGTYSAKLTVNTSVGQKTNTTSCHKTFTVSAAKTPGVTITKTVDGKKEETIALGQSYNYEITVTNTGNVALTNGAVTDPAPEGVQFTGATLGTISNNTWSYTIPSLAIGQSKIFTITAKATKQLTGTVRNTACVDAPQVPGSPDACDHADVIMPPKVPGKVVVCNASTGEIVSVNESDASSFEPVNSDKCKAAPTPSSLPVTGPAEAVFKMIGAGSLTGATTYYVASRRKA